MFALINARPNRVCATDWCGCSFLVKLHEHADLDVMGKTNQQDISLRLDCVLGRLWKVI